MASQAISRWYGKCVKKIFNIDAKLLEEAQAACGATTYTRKPCGAALKPWCGMPLIRLADFPGIGTTRPRRHPVARETRR